MCAKRIVHVNKIQWRMLLKFTNAFKYRVGTAVLNILYTRERTKSARESLRMYLGQFRVVRIAVVISRLGGIRLLFFLFFFILNSRIAHGNCTVCCYLIGSFRSSGISSRACGSKDGSERLMELSS